MSRSPTSSDVRLPFNITTTSSCLHVNNVKIVIRRNWGAGGKIHGAEIQFDYRRRMAE
jgi:hypothetical protein